MAGFPCCLWAAGRRVRGQASGHGCGGPDVGVGLPSLVSSWALCLPVGLPAKPSVSRTAWLLKPRAVLTLSGAAAVTAPPGPLEPLLCQHSRGAVLRAKGHVLLRTGAP